MPVTLRDVTAGDMAQIRKIYAHHVLNGAASFEEIPPDLAEMQNRFAALKAKNMPYVAAVESTEGGGDRILGYAYAGPYRPRAAYRYTVEDSIYLLPDQAGKGLGKMLLAELVARSTALGMRQMIAIIGDSANVGSINLHRSLGFATIGTFPAIGFKFGRWIDSVLMQKALGEGQESLPK